MIVASSQSVYEYSLREFGCGDVEELHCIALDSACAVIASHMVARGTVNACFAHPRDIFRFAIARNAVGIILVHNHPSGDARPSAEDVRLTGKIRAAGRLLQVPLLDHVIVGARSYFSFADSGAFVRRGTRH